VSFVFNNSVPEQLKELRKRLGERDVQLNSIYDAMENQLILRTGQDNSRKRSIIYKFETKFIPLKSHGHTKRFV